MRRAANHWEDGDGESGAGAEERGYRLHNAAIYRASLGMLGQPRAGGQEGPRGGKGPQLNAKGAVSSSTVAPGSVLSGFQAQQH